VYSETRRNLQLAISNYRSGQIDLDAFKSSVWKAASQVSCIEDKDIRSFLQQAEAELDSLQFTVNEELLFQEALKVADRICDYLHI